MYNVKLALLSHMLCKGVIQSSALMDVRHYQL